MVADFQKKEMGFS